LSYYYISVVSVNESGWNVGVLNQCTCKWVSNACNPFTTSYRCLAYVC